MVSSSSDRPISSISVSPRRRTVLRPCSADNVSATSRRFEFHISKALTHPSCCSVHSRRWRNTSRHLHLGSYTLDNCQCYGNQTRQEGAMPNPLTCLNAIELCLGEAQIRIGTAESYTRPRSDLCTMSMKRYAIPRQMKVLRHSV